MLCTVTPDNIRYGGNFYYYTRCGLIVKGLGDFFLEAQEKMSGPRLFFLYQDVIRGLVQFYFVLRGFFADLFRQGREKPHTARQKRNEKKRG